MRLESENFANITNFFAKINYNWRYVTKKLTVISFAKSSNNFIKYVIAATNLFSLKKS